jgi:hypothetical protein
MYVVVVAAESTSGEVLQYRSALMGYSEAHERCMRYRQMKHTSWMEDAEKIETNRKVRKATSG